MHSVGLYTTRSMVKVNLEVMSTCGDWQLSVMGRFSDLSAGLLFNYFSKYDKKVIRVQFPA